MGGVVLGILVWQEGGSCVGLLMGLGAVALVLLARWLLRRKREHKVTLLDPDLFRIRTSPRESRANWFSKSRWAER